MPFGKDVPFTGSVDGSNKDFNIAGKSPAVLIAGTLCNAQANPASGSPFTAAGVGARRHRLMVNGLELKPGADYSFTGIVDLGASALPPWAANGWNDWAVTVSMVVAPHTGASFRFQWGYP